MSNQLGASRRVDALCGTVAILRTPAMQNFDRTLNDAVDRDSKQW